VPGGRVFFLESSAISTQFRHNEQIRISPIFLIDQDDVKVGSTTTADALRKAREAGLDLVEVAPNARPPVCKIMDYGKWRYQQQKKEDKSRASSRAGQLKELKLRTVKIGDHDLQIKINHAREFLKEGNKVQFTLQFKGREMAHTELGRDIFRKIKEELWPVSKVDALISLLKDTMGLEAGAAAPAPEPEKKKEPEPAVLPSLYDAMIELGHDEFAEKLIDLLFVSDYWYMVYLRTCVVLEGLYIEAGKPLPARAIQGLRKVIKYDVGMAAKWSARDLLKKAGIMVRVPAKKST